MLASALLLVFPALMAWAAASDLLTMTIPNRLTLGLAGAFVVFAVAARLPPWEIAMCVAASAAVLAVCFGLFAMGWMGGGDAKLAAASALWFGFAPLMDYLLTAALAGGGLTLALLGMRTLTLPRFALGWPWLVRLHDKATGVPYGIALAFAALAVYPQSPIWTAVVAG